MWIGHPHMVGMADTGLNDEMLDGAYYINTGVFWLSGGSIQANSGSPVFGEIILSNIPRERIQEKRFWPVAARPFESLSPVLSR